MTVFWAESEQQKPSTYSISEVKSGVEIGQEVIRKKESVVFEDDSSLGSIFFGMGVVRSLLQKDKDILVVLNPADMGEE